MHILPQLKRRGCVLFNPFNPSTKRLPAIEVKELRGNEAVVRTTEYWYLNRARRGPPQELQAGSLGWSCANERAGVRFVEGVAPNEQDRIRHATRIM